MYVIECPHLSLDKIFASGQVPRWRRMSDGKYLVTDGEQAVKVVQSRNKLLFNCGEDEFYSKWFDYFDMKTDHEMLNYRISRCGDIMKVWANRSQGVRVVRQDLFEILVSSILSEGRTRYHAGIVINCLCKACGNKHIQGMAESGKVRWYEFPSPEQILDNMQQICNTLLGVDTDSMLAQYLQFVCRLYCDGHFDVDRLSAMEYSDAKEYLVDKGLSEWAADYVCLYGLHMMEAYPNDDAVGEALAKSFGDSDLVEVCDWYFPKLQSQKGLVYQYVLYNLLNPPVEFVYTGFGRRAVS